MHICQQTNVTCITHPTVTHTPPASIHMHNVFLSPVAHKGLGKWWGMEEISTLIALFIYTGKAQGIWSMFTYRGETFHLDWEMQCSHLLTKALSIENHYSLQKYLQISERKEQDAFFFFSCELV